VYLLAEFHKKIATIIFYFGRGCMGVPPLIVSDFSSLNSPSPLLYNGLKVVTNEKGEAVGKVVTIIC
jgi:hypothetical protein